MAFKIEKEDTRANVHISVSVPAALYEDIAALAGMNESSVKHIVVQVLKAGCKENKTAIDEWKSANPAKLAALMKPEKSEKTSSGLTNKTLTARA